MQQHNCFDPASSCAGKIRHQTQASANRHAAHTGHGKSYRCKFCTGWHIGNVPNRPERSVNPRP